MAKGCHNGGNVTKQTVSYGWSDTEPTLTFQQSHLLTCNFTCEVDNKKGGASKYKHQEGEKQEEGHDRLSKIKVGVKKKCSSKYNHEEEEVEEEEEEDEATNKRAREEEERIGDEEDIVPPSKKKTAAEFRKHLDEQMWERRKLDQMQRNLQELRNEVLSLKNENTRLKDIIINHWKDSCGGSRFLLDFWRNASDSREETEPFNESPMVTERFRETPQTAATAETSAKTQIEVIKGSGVFCQAEAWRAARLATSATAMVGSQPEGMGSSWSPLTKLKRRQWRLHKMLH
ncbi:uncharacterized protein [Paramormyrops kingsleyae]|uniref:uncharacterized protein n=1 Tax=Paramormyrops kingsleyae TaxID=1676925 RepID=UPI003B9776F4